MFDANSLKHLKFIHPDLQLVLLESRKRYDFIITDSVRGKKKQQQALKDGFSTVEFGESPHNYNPCPVADIAPAPYKLYRDNIPRYIELQIRIIKVVAAELKIPIRQGLDWNRNGILTDEKFRDYPHVELYPWRKFKGTLYNG